MEFEGFLMSNVNQGENMILASKNRISKKKEILHVLWFLGH